MTPIKGIIFDLGRVLVGIDSRRGLPGYLGLTGPDEIRQLTADPSFAAYNCGRLCPEEFHQRVVARFDLSLSFTEFRDIWCDMFYLHEDMLALLEELGRSYRLGLLSDTDPLHWGHICRAYPKIMQIFSNPSLSFEIGALKPDPETYADAVRKIGLQPQECVFIDDLPGNIAGACAAGLHGIVFTGCQTLRGELAALGIAFRHD